MGFVSPVSPVSPKITLYVALQRTHHTGFGIRAARSDNETARNQCQPSSAHAFHFQRVRKVSVAVSNLGLKSTGSITIRYYRDVWLPVIYIIIVAVDAFVFQQDNALAHSAHYYYERV